MGSTKRESRVAAMAAFIIVAAAGAFAEERLKRANASTGSDNQTPVRRIVISIADRKLALLEGDRIIKIWSTAVGTESTPSPAGTYTIINRVSQPAYYGPGKVVPPGAANPVGTRWLGLSLKGFGIHGTNRPGSIGRKASHGCIRMLNRDVEELFDLVSVGDAVELHKERDAQMARIFRLTSSPESVSDRKTSTIITLASNR